MLSSAPSFRRSMRFPKLSVVTLHTCLWNCIRLTSRLGKTPLIRSLKKPDWLSLTPYNPTAKFEGDLMARRIALPGVWALPFYSMNTTVLSPPWRTLAAASGFDLQQEGVFVTGSVSKCFGMVANRMGWSLETAGFSPDERFQRLPDPCPLALEWSCRLGFSGECRSFC